MAESAEFRNFCRVRPEMALIAGLTGKAVSIDDVKIPRIHLTAIRHNQSAIWRIRHFPFTTIPEDGGNLGVNAIFRTQWFTLRVYLTAQRALGIRLIGERTARPGIAPDARNCWRLPSYCGYA